ncbi:collagen-like triple helix repeat-containing protein [Zobellia alginiliquefaciens]|uniref:collagen-like triple helix repeat-containing protein n=1 Tax=Zobellia alginiliquefaciens TaxID=3032586 RepID=UPI0023E39F8E|nr:collagen-like protein [Zobellia alginiliquefaciens]
MKRTLLLLGTAFTLFFISCEGPTGPPGFDGEPGQDGLDGIQGQVFEVDDVDFTYIPEDNLYESILVFEDFTSFEVLPNDAVLVYQYDRTVEFQDGSQDDVWNLIPQAFFTNNGTIQYTPGHTTKDVEILISGNYDLSNLETQFTQGQLFRFVIVPGQAATAKIDKSSISAVMSSMGLTEADVQKISRK